MCNSQCVKVYDRKLDRESTCSPRIILPKQEIKYSELMTLLYNRRVPPLFLSTPQPPQEEKNPPVMSKSSTTANITTCDPPHFLHVALYKPPSLWYTNFRRKQVR